MEVLHVDLAAALDALGVLGRHFEVFRLGARLLLLQVVPLLVLLAVGAASISFRGCETAGA
jgi:hypothetical protein